MRWHRILPPERIKMEIHTAPGDPEQDDDRDAGDRKEAVLWELVELLETSGKVSNPNKLFLDLRNRERKATTGIGQGVAIPHVRTKQVTGFIAALARSSPGIDFASVDGEKVHLFIAMVAPPYDDRSYLRMYARIGGMFLEEGLLERLLAASGPHEIIRILDEASR